MPLLRPQTCENKMEEQKSISDVYISSMQRQHYLCLFHLDKRLHLCLYVEYATVDREEGAGGGWNGADDMTTVGGESFYLFFLHCECIYPCIGKGINKVVLLCSKNCFASVISLISSSKLHQSNL